MPDMLCVATTVTIMFGLAFGAVPNMFLLPIFYACFFKVPSPPK